METGHDKPYCNTDFGKTQVNRSALAKGLMNDTSEITKTEGSRSLLAAVIQFIPAALVMLRFFIGPLLLLNAINGKTDAWFIVGFVAAFLSDIFDGVIARRLGVIATAKAVKT